LNFAHAALTGCGQIFSIFSSHPILRTGVIRKYCAHLACTRHQPASEETVRPVCVQNIQGDAIQAKSFIHDVNQQITAVFKPLEIHLGSTGPSGIHNSHCCIGRWWRQTGSNRRPEACKATALPTELCPQLAIVPGEAGKSHVAFHGGPGKT
jgi:hypothetical protein